MPRLIWITPQSEKNSLFTKSKHSAESTRNGRSSVKFSTRILTIILGMGYIRRASGMSRDFPYPVPPRRITLNIHTPSRESVRFLKWPHCAKTVSALQSSRKNNFVFVFICNTIPGAIATVHESLPKTTFLQI